MFPDLRQFLDILPEPSFLMTVEGVVSFANAAAVRAAGGLREELIGKRFAHLLRGNTAQFASYLRLCARSRQFLPGSIRLAGADGEMHHWRCDGAAVAVAPAPGLVLIRCRPREQATESFVALNRRIGDLTREVLERRKAEWQRDELLRSERAARLEAERSSRMKDEFLANLSHELRTPLHAIFGWTAMLQVEAQNENVRQGLAIIARNARTQTQLIDDLLDMSRIVSGKLRLERQPLALSGVIETAVASIRPAAEARRIELRVVLDARIAPVCGDADRLQQVVWNLLNNAVKFSLQGGCVQVELRRSGETAQILVADHGEGIEASFLPRVFDRFQQADASTTRRYGGLGLGLAIARHLVELHGGSIRAESAGLGQGATFYVELPLAERGGLEATRAERSPAADCRSRPGSPAAGASGSCPEPARAVAAGEREPAPASSSLSAAAKAPDLSGSVVLIVDDEPDGRGMVARLLEMSNAVVWQAASADQALARLREATPDVIVSDIGMPEVDGYRFLAQVHTVLSARGEYVPALALTAFSRADDRARASLAGYTQHLAKPIEPRALLDAVAEVIAAHPRRRSAAAD